MCSIPILLLILFLLVDGGEENGGGGSGNIAGLTRWSRYFSESTRLSGRTDRYNVMEFISDDLSKRPRKFIHVERTFSHRVSLCTDRTGFRSYLQLLNTSPSSPRCFVVVFKRNDYVSCRTKKIQKLKFSRETDEERCNSKCRQLARVSIIA